MLNASEIHAIIDDSKFTSINRDNWVNNVNYWLSSPLRHVEDNIEEIRDLITSECKSEFNVLDIGCGNGFFYELIKNIYPDLSYVGMDFNENFISHLEKKYTEDTNSKFICIDVTQPFDESYTSKFDIVFCFFVMFEISDLNALFNNIYKTLKPNGKLFVYTIEYIYLLIAISKDYPDLKLKLIEFEKIKKSGKTPFTFQKIDMDTTENESLTYGSVFYTTADFVNLGISNGFILQKITENYEMYKFHPKTYQLF